MIALINNISDPDSRSYPGSKYQNYNFVPAELASLKYNTGIIKIQSNNNIRLIQQSTSTPPPGWCLKSGSRAPSLSPRALYISYSCGTWYIHTT